MKNHDIDMIVIKIVYNPQKYSSYELRIRYILSLEISYAVLKLPQPTPGRRILKFPLHLSKRENGIHSGYTLRKFRTYYMLSIHD